MFKICRNLAGATLLACGLFSTTAFGGVISFSDAEFANSNWVGVEILDTTPNDSFVFSATQIGVGGNPNSYRQVINELNTTAASDIASGHLFQGGNFDPGQDGTFVSLDMSFDGIGINGPAGAMGYGVLLEQDGNYFSVGLGQVLNGRGWAAFNGIGLIESNFSALGTGVLDFSIGGSPIGIGFLVSNGTFGLPSTNEGGVDNWSISITTSAAQIPEPASLTLFGLGLLSLCAARRRNKNTT